jgi:ADP-dependent NAD(P)H-hydrate dehydratase / NAD(P)H-hydrate epimerase
LRGATGREDVALLSAAEMQAWDRRAVERDGVQERVLMEAAGRAAAQVIQRLYPDGVLIAVVGRGHNGGDAIIAARTLQAWGREVSLIPVRDEVSEAGLLHGWALPLSAAGADATLSRAGVVIDGLLGTGARGAPREPHASYIEAINRCGRPVVAIDGPSGVDFTTGQTAGPAIRAELTVTFGAPKRGLLLYPGRALAGRIVAVEIGFPPLRSSEASAFLITPGWARARIPRVPPNAHKGRLGDVVVVAGSRGVAGAAALVGGGAARAGAGKVYLVSTADNREILQLALPEALFVEREGGQLGELLENADAVAVGPGIGIDDAARRVLETVLTVGEAPLVIDADALTLIAQEPSLMPASGRKCLLTPHPGEMSRLIDREPKDIAADPFGALDAALERSPHALLLKGSPSLVAAPGEPILANLAGHSGIATGGMGDTLAGIAAALLAQGCRPREAGALALYLSGRAAELVGRGRSLLPRDVAEALPAAFLEPEPASDLQLPGVCLDLLPPQ